jgi:hypothetical protein
MPQSWKMSGACARVSATDSQKMAKPPQRRLNGKKNVAQLEEHALAWPCGPQQALARQKF